MQVWRRKSESRLLICAPSNNAADLLAVKLIEHVPPGQMLRPLPRSRQDQPIDKAIECICTFRPVNAMDFMAKRIIITTLSSASKLYRGGLQKSFITHVFVDEAGQATEPETLLAIAGVIGPLGEVTLAGKLYQSTSSHS